MPTHETPPPPSPGPRDNARRTLGAGLLILACSLGLVLLPLLLGHWSVNRYFVAFGLIGACLGLSCLLHGAWDWLRGRQS